MWMRLLWFFSFSAFLVCHSKEFGTVRSNRQTGRYSTKSSSEKDDLEWLSIPMPENSYFAGFQPPDDPDKWRKAQEDAMRGSPVLLNQVLKTIKCPGDILTGEKKFKWIHRLVDVFVNRKVGVETAMKNYTGYRAPVVSMGYKVFDRKDMEGQETRTFTFSPSEILSQLKKGKLNFPRKFIAVGLMDENWGWISTHFLNRTASWGFTIDKSLSPYTNVGWTDQLAPFLDNPNLLMLLVNQHHNVGNTLTIG